MIVRYIPQRSSYWLGRQSFPNRPKLRQKQLLSTASSTQLVDWQVDKDGIGTLTLQSPQTYNALTVEMGVQFAAQCRAVCDADAAQTATDGVTDATRHHATELKAVVLTGAGHDAFSAGGNYDWLHGLRHNSVHANVDLMLRFYNSFLCIRTLPVPVVAALCGPAIGAGAGLALACDMRVATCNKKALLGFPFTKLGIHSGMGGSHLLANVIGGQAGLMNEILLLGKTLSSEQCLELGLVNAVADDAKHAAYEMARNIAAQHPVAVRSLMQTLRVQQDAGLPAALQREATAQAMCYARSDWGEGVSAVAEKRAPSFAPYHEK